MWTKDPTINEPKWHYYAEENNNSYCGKKPMPGTPIVSEKVPEYGYVCASCLFYHDMGCGVTKLSPRDSEIFNQMMKEDKEPNEPLQKAVEKYKKNIEQYPKPPLGLSPTKIWYRDRLIEIHEAMIRYTDANKPIPTQWIEDYNDLAHDLNNQIK